MRGVKGDIRAQSAGFTALVEVSKELRRYHDTTTNSLHPPAVITKT